VFNVVLIAVVGELGIGKTLTLTYLLWNNWYYKNRNVCANYNIYGIPFTPVRTLEDLQKMIPAHTPTLEELKVMKETVFGGDELWKWIDSRTSVMDVKESVRKNIKNKVVTDILAASRKAFVTVIYTAQTIRQIDKRIRDVTDFTVYPLIRGENYMCHARFFAGTSSQAYSMDKDIRFFCEPFLSMFNTFERILPLEEGYTSEEIFQSIEINPAWVKYCLDRGMKENLIEKYSKEIEASLKENKA
jgi:hypothetical protein